jgi:hypothetical protein
MKSAEMSIEEIIKKGILESPELAEIIDQRTEEKIRTSKLSQCYTRKDLAGIFKVSVQTVDRLTDEELEDRGLRRISVGSLVRFQCIQREMFRKAKK